jgi:nucleoside-diphosphate-sugar epimerase
LNAPLAKLNFVTGATGLLGGHIAELLRARGERVRALVRPGSDTAYLRELGVEIVQGDLLDPTCVHTAAAGADIVYHCAARIGNWGSWSDFRRDVVDTTRNVLEACAAARVGRVLHVSSVSVYGHPRLGAGRAITEDEPLAQRLGFLDYYARAKVAAERLAWRHPCDLTVVRPSWLYGPRDRNSFPRLVQALKDGWVSLIGDGNNLLNIVYAADVAQGAIAAANNPAAVHQAFHLCSAGEITQRQFFDTLTSGLGLPPVTKSVSVRLASWGGLLGELLARALRWRRSPHVTQYGTGLLTRSTSYSIAKARKELSWSPAVPAEEGLRRTLTWFLQPRPGDDKRVPPAHR